MQHNELGDIRFRKKLIMKLAISIAVASSHISWKQNWTILYKLDDKCRSGCPAWNIDGNFAARV
jgi:hypothetical protein